MLNAAEVVRDAKRLAFPAYISGKVSDASLVAMLANIETDLLMQVHQIAPWLLEMESTEAVVRADNVSGYLLTAAPYGYSSFIYHRADTDEHFNIEVVPDVDQYKPNIKHPAIYIREQTMFPVDPLGLGWEDMTDERHWFWDASDIIKYRHHIGHTPIATIIENLNVPDFSRGFVVASLATQILLGSNATEAQLTVALQREQKYWNTVLMHLYKAVPITSRVGV